MPEDTSQAEVRENLGCAHKMEHFNWHLPSNLVAEQKIRIMVMLLEEIKKKHSEVKCPGICFFFLKLICG